MKAHLFWILAGPMLTRFQMELLMRNRKTPVILAILIFGSCAGASLAQLPRVVDSQKEFAACI